MRAFACPSCRRLAPFESVLCLHCGSEHGVDWRVRELLALRPDGPGGTLEVVGDGGQRFRCANLELAGCNGLVDEAEPLCPACRLTRTRPDDDDGEGLANFVVAEAAKRRLLFELGELGLPLAARRPVADGDGEEVGLAFDLLSSSVAPVVTGHAAGVVTIDLAEADDAHREAVRAQMAEPYRTVLGHLRHEIGHYYEPLIVVADDDVAECRRLFGDDRDDYSAAMDRHYEQGPPADWEQRFVSAYATMHPWEDWAETFAHYLHIRDTLQTAGAYGMRVDGPEWVAGVTASTLRSEPREVDGAATADDDLQPLLDAWLPLTYALNAINRSMGAEDLYPFVLTPAVIEKLGFVHRMVLGAAVPEPMAA